MGMGEGKKIMLMKGRFNSSARSVKHEGGQRSRKHPPSDSHAHQSRLLTSGVYVYKMMALRSLENE